MWATQVRVLSSICLIIFACYSRRLVHTHTHRSDSYTHIGSKRDKKYVNSVYDGGNFYF